MDYGAVLSRAWHITWRNKGLWILGILAGCSGGSGGGGGGRAPSFNFGGNGQGPGADAFQNIPDEVWPVIILGIVCLILFLVIRVVVLGAIGKGGLIAGFNLADEGQTVTLGKAFSLSLTYFWKVVAIQLLIGLAWFFVLLIVAGVAALGVLATFGIGLICILPALCLLIPLGVAVGVYATLTQAAVIIEDKGILEAFKSSWDTVKSNVGPVVIMALVLVIGGAIVRLLIGLPALALIAPVITGVAIGSQASITSGLVIFGLCLVAYIPVALLLNGILETYIAGSWALTYRRLTDRSGVESLPEPAA
jgi:hypothetical protein